MADRELRKMNRRELLELLIASEKENERLKASVEQLKAQLQSRDIQIANAGSLAEAALTLNGFFESADKAAEQYLETLRNCIEQQQEAYDRIVSEAEAKAQAILEEAENEKKQIVEAADEYWKDLKEQLEIFYLEHSDLDEYYQLYYRKNAGTDEETENKDNPSELV